MVLPTLVGQTAQAQRSEEFSEWRHPHDLVALADTTIAALPAAYAAAAATGARIDDAGVAALGVALPRRRPDTRSSTRCSTRCAPASTTSNSVGRSPTRPRCASPASTSRTTTRDWNTIHHSFTAANALHHALQRNPTPDACGAAVCTPRCASTSTASSTCPPPVCPRATTGDLDHTRAVLRDAGRRRRRGQRRRTASCVPAARARR